MATIEERKGKDGKSTFRCCIRKKGIEFYKTFDTKEDAQLYEFYKERLIDNMQAFDVPLKDRITLKQLFELKYKDVTDQRSVSDCKRTLEILNDFIPMNEFLNKFTYENWLNAAKEIAISTKYISYKTKGESMSLATLRRLFAVASSVFSHAQSLGIEIDNHPLKVLQTFINPKLKE